MSHADAWIPLGKKIYEHLPLLAIPLRFLAAVTFVLPKVMKYPIISNSPPRLQSYNFAIEDICCFIEASNAIILLTTKNTYPTMNLCEVLLLGNQSRNLMMSPRSAKGRDYKFTDYLFPGGRRGGHLSNMAMIKVVKTLGYETVTVHGFRSTFRDWAGGMTIFPREIAEQALAHQIGDATEQAYRRSDGIERRRELMEAWDRFVSGEGAEIVELGRADNG